MGPEAIGLPLHGFNLNYWCLPGDRWKWGNHRRPRVPGDGGPGFWKIPGEKGFPRFRPWRSSLSGSPGFWIQRDTLAPNRLFFQQGGAVGISQPVYQAAVSLKQELAQAIRPWGPSYPPFSLNRSQSESWTTHVGNASNFSRKNPSGTAPICLSGWCRGGSVPTYIDCRPYTHNGRELALIGKIFFELIRNLDVTTTGGSALKAVAVARAFGLPEVRALILVDRHEGGKEGGLRRGRTVHDCGVGLGNHIHNYADL
jgi:hypothetical protein